MRIGSLCSGYGGLERGVQAVYGGTTAWVSDIDKGACKILAHRFPGVPNLGDMTAVDWAAIEPVDLICGGTPCQDLSHASWHGIRASDVGAPHGRFRVFVVATDAQRGGRGGRAPDALGSQVSRVAAARGGAGALLPTPRTNGAGAHGTGGVDLRTAVGLLPTPRATDGTKGGPGQRGSSGDLMLPSAVALLPASATRDHKGRNQRDDATCLTGALLPTPTSMDAQASGDGYNGQSNVTLTDATVRRTHGPAWGDYAPAIARWEHAIGRPAPEPTMTSRKGNPQLAPAFVEWMMGLPAGWVTDVPDLTRNEALRALGNGVVPQQAAAALVEMASWEAAA